MVEELEKHFLESHKAEPMKLWGISHPILQRTYSRAYSEDSSENDSSESDISQDHLPLG